ncbi:uncharacterized protein LOC134777718 [Penaeus indicus]|uniref:uncharacterized protein LOC134777718 n=1 Tax=Penaeus indicus TaxID=29960 RepID=UPI00300D3534
MRETKIPESYVRVVQDMYEGCTTRVRTAWTSEEEHHGICCSLMTWRHALERRGMRVSRKKTEYLCTSGGQKEEGTIRIGDVQLNRVKDFKYLGSTVQEDGGTEQEIARRIQSGWNRWKKITGVVCDRKVPDKVKGNLHKLMVRPAKLYGLETVPLTKSQERKLEVAEMRMMRYEVGVIRLDKIKNETTREILGIGRYGWFWHVYRRDEGYVGKRVMSIIVGKRKKRRPKRRWIDCIRDDMRSVGLQEEEASNRNAWKGTSQ